MDPLVRDHCDVAARGDPRLGARALSLYDLLDGSGIGAGKLARELDVPKALLDSIDAGRQPLPADLAELVAAVLELDIGTVNGTAELVTSGTGPIWRTIVPPDPFVDGVLSATPIAATAPIVLPKRSVFSAWVCGTGIAGANGGVMLLDRELGIVGQVEFPIISPSVELAFGTDGLVYAFNLGGGRTSALTVFPFALSILATDANNGVVNGICFEPTTRTMWGGCQDASGGVEVLKEIDPLTSFRAPVQLGGNDATVFSLIAAGGKVYATAAHGGAGRVVEMDPSTRTVLRTSTGPSMVAAQGLAWDGADTLLVADFVDLYAVSISTMVAVHLSGVTPVVANWATYLRGAFWVSDESGGKPRVLRLTVAGSVATVLADLSFTGSTGAAGHVACDADGVFWLSCPDEGAVRTFDGMATSGDPTMKVVVTGGRPQGLIVL